MMEKISLGDSLKNIQILLEKNYLFQLVKKLVLSNQKEEIEC